MKILEHVEKLRHEAKTTGNYLRMSEKAGVSDSWLIKFANGKILNPTVDSVDKLERTYCQQTECAQESAP
jgi:transcriptional regulator with XRE-family HTH domain